MAITRTVSYSVAITPSQRDPAMVRATLRKLWWQHTVGTHSREIGQIELRRVESEPEASIVIRVLEGLIDQIRQP